MILTVKDNLGRRKRRKKSLRRNILKIVMLLIIIVVPLVILYNYIFIVRYVDAPTELKGEAEKTALGKPLYTIKKESILSKIEGYPKYDISLMKIIPGKLVIRKKSVEPEVYLADMNLYIDKNGNLFGSGNKVLYAPLKVYGQVDSSKIKTILNISRKGIFKTIRVNGRYFMGKIGHVKICFTSLDDVMIRRIKLVMSKEQRKYYTMDLRFRNQVIIR